MRRRQFLALAAATAAFPRVAFAQQATKVPRIAYLSPTNPVEQLTETGNANTAAFLKELRRLGFVEGTNITIDRYSGNADPSTYTDVTRQAVASNPDLIVVTGAPMSQAAVAATKTIPIVFETAAVIAYGLVTNYNHPGGNATGVDRQPATIEGRRMQLLHEAAPTAKRIACFGSESAWEVLGQEVKDSSARLGLDMVPMIARSPITEASYHDAFASMASQKVEMLQLMNSPENNTFGTLIGALAADARMPGISWTSPFVDGGGLMSYGANIATLFARSAGYVALILNGATPGDLPVIQPDAYDFIVSLKAAKDVGFDLPQSIIASATELRQ